MDFDNLSDKDKERIHNEIFDSCVIIKNQWFMYGSGKKINKNFNLYELEYIFDSNLDELEQIPNLKNLIKILSIRKIDIKLSNLKSNSILNERIEEIKSKYLKKVSNKIDVNKFFIKNNDINNKITKLIGNSTNNNNDSINIAKKLMKLISPKRAGPYNDWIVIGWALFNVSPTLLPEFINFSKSDKNKYQEGCCEKLWDDSYKYVGDRGYTIASL